MNKALDIIPECFVDTNLVGWLLGKGVNHQHGCNNVTAVMQNAKLKDAFAIGIVDDDKRKSKYVDVFERVAATNHLEIRKHPDKPHFLIFVKKAAEDFIISAANEIGYDLACNNLSNDLEELKKTTKTCQSNEDKNLRKAFAALGNSSEVKIFKNILKYLEGHKYDAEVNVIKNIFADADFYIWNLPHENEGAK